MEGLSTTPPALKYGVQDEEGRGTTLVTELRRRMTTHYEHAPRHMTISSSIASFRVATLRLQHHFMWHTL
jgi:hypothetical protein